MVKLGAPKVGPRPKNNILGQILQAKKSMLAILKRFEILHILSYLITLFWQIFSFGNNDLP